MTRHYTLPGRSPAMTRVSRTLTQVTTAALLVLGGCSDEQPTGPEPLPAPVASVTIVPETIQLTVGETRQLAASPRDAQGNTLTRPVTWTSTDADVATVNASGTVRAIAGGTVTIRAASEGKQGNAAVQVQVAIPAELELSRSNLMFTGIAAIQSPAPASVNVTAKNGVANGLVAQIHYGTGDPQGRLTATFSATAAPAALTITTQTGMLLPGSYTARIALRSSTKPEIMEKSVNVMFVVQPRPAAERAQRRPPRLRGRPQRRDVLLGHERGRTARHRRAHGPESTRQGRRRPHVLSDHGRRRAHLRPGGKR